MPTDTKVLNVVRVIACELADKVREDLIAVQGTDLAGELEVILRRYLPALPDRLLALLIDSSN